MPEPTPTPTPVPPSAWSDGHHALSEFHAFMAIAAVCGARAAEAETGAPLQVHAARMSAVLGEVLAELAVMRVLAAEVPR